MFIRPQKFIATVGTKKQLNPKITELTLNLVEPKIMQFYPGQFVSVEVAPDTFRAYSVSSPSNESNNTRLIIETAHEGKGSNYTRSLKLGDTVTFIGPSGKFQLPKVLPDNIVFIATGTGFAPFESMLYELINKNYLGKIDFFFGIRNKEELFKLDFLKKCEILLSNFKYYLCFSRELPLEESNSYYGRVTNVLPDQLLNKKTNTQLKDNTLFFICGNEHMIQSTTDILINYGVNENNILTEYFTPADKQ